MISRNFIRIKVMQSLYRKEVSGSLAPGNEEKILLNTFDDVYVLYLRLLTLFEVLTYTNEKIIDLKKQKLLPTEKDLKPNLKFIENQFIKKISSNTSLQAKAKEYNLSWYTDIDLLFVRKVYDSLSNQPFFISYLQDKTQSFALDKTFVLELIEKFFLENELLQSFFGEQKLHWLHDYNDAVLLVYNTLKQYKETQSDDKALPSLFKIVANGQSEDKQFLIDLFRKTQAKDKEYLELISGKIKNWETDRIAVIDLILLKMALCEFCEFPSIPLRVTLNEYIELSKYYSTPKSKFFINGLLDNILMELKQENKINKQGRGLMG